MLQAWLILPALGLTYLIAANTNWRKRVAHLAAAAVVVLVVSFSWALLVDATPASQRPYVGGSQTDSVLELIFGYNGVQRVVSTGGMGGGMGMQEGGNRGVLRLFNDTMGGQASWLLALTPFCILTLALSLRQDKRQRALRHLVLWTGWLVLCYAYFCVSGFFHRYYLATMAPAIAALVGVGVVAMARRCRRPGWQAHLLPVALVVCAGVQFVLLQPYGTWANALVPVVAGLLLVAVAGLIAAQVLRWVPSLAAVRVFGALGVAALLVVPAVWSVVTVADGSNTMLPVAGPSLQGGTGGFGPAGGGQAPGGFGGGQRGSQPPGNGFGRGGDGLGQGFGGGQGGVSNELIAYLTENHSGETFLVAVASANTAAPIMLQTGLPVMAVGGFTGNDPALTVEELEQMVANHELRYFLTGGERRSGNDAIMSWIQQHGTAVAQGGGGLGGGTLWDLNPEENDVIDAGEGQA